MMRSILLLCAIASPASALLLKRTTKPSAPAEPKRKATAKVYVMNMAESPDRCECMQQQLIQSPHPVVRFEGANHHHLKSIKNCTKDIATMKHQKNNVPAYL